MKPSKPKKWKWQLSEQLKKAIEMNNTCDDNLERELRELQLKKEAVIDEHKKRKENFIKSQKKVTAGRWNSKNDYSVNNARSRQPDSGERRSLSDHQQKTEGILAPRRRRQTLPVIMSIEKSDPSVGLNVLQRDGLHVNHRDNRLLNKTSVGSGIQPTESASKPFRKVDEDDVCDECAPSGDIHSPFLRKESLSESIHDWIPDQISNSGLCETTINFADSRSCLAKDRCLSLQECLKLPALKPNAETKNKPDERAKEPKNVDNINLFHELQNATKPKSVFPGRRRQTVHGNIVPLERVVSGKILSIPGDKNEFHDCAIIPQTQEIKT